MTREDTRIVISSATGKNVYIDAQVSRTVARRVESLLEENNVVMVTPHADRQRDRRAQEPS